MLVGLMLYAMPRRGSAWLALDDAVVIVAAKSEVEGPVLQRDRVLDV